MAMTLISMLMMVLNGCCVTYYAIIDMVIFGVVIGFLYPFTTDGLKCEYTNGSKFKNLKSVDVLAT